jgi:hypothetical protein
LKRVAGSIGVLFAIVAVAHAGGEPSIDQVPIQAIDQFCDGLQVMTTEKKGRRLFGVFQEDNYSKGRWVEFKRERDLNAAVKQDHVFDIAQLWSREDGAIAVSMRLSSASADWFHFVEYCFRADGTLARVNSTLNTFNAADKDPEKDVSGASRERDRYFDASGAQIKVRRRVLDLKTKRPAPTLRVMDDAEPIYKTAAALPFHGLLKSRHPAVNPAGTLPYKR